MTLAGLVAANNLNDVTDIERTWDNLGSNISATIFVPSPTLDLNFAANKSLVDSVSGNNLITFTRASTGTFVGSNGLIQNAASNVARFDHNPSTGESLGLLVEEARTNSLLYSQQFDNAAWGKNSSTIASSAAVAPDGTSTAQKLVEDASNATHSITVGVPIDTYKTVTLFAKAAERNWIGIGLFDTARGWVYSFFNLSTGTIGTNPDGNAVITALSNGWYRIQIGRQANAGSTLRILLQTANGTNTYNGDSNNYTGDGSSGAFIWGAQVESAATFPTSYIPTSGSTVTRATDIVSITGANFSSWFSQNGNFTIYSEFIGLRNSYYSNTYTELFTFSTGFGVLRRSSTSVQWAKPADGWADRGGFNSLSSTTIKTKLCSAISNYYGYTFADSTGVTTVTRTAPSDAFPAPSSIQFVTAPGGACSTLSRITYYPVRLPDRTLQVFASSGVSSSFPYSFSIKGKDILALKQVNRASTRDFIFIRGLTSNAQARITTASQYTASGVALRNVAMLKTAPTTVGNYFFSSGLTVSGVSCQINGTNALSIATSPFSGSGATVPLLFAGLRPQANWRMTEAMTSGTVTAPESAIPIETEDFLLFIKVGQG
jgi:hypothetical protein